MDKKYLMDREEIKAVLPHRDPFLFVDRVLEITENRIVAEWYVSPEAPFFKGHFPGKPVMPGVLQVEAMAQAGGVMMLVKGENKGKIAYLIAVDKARFRKMVLPGDTLTFEVTVLKMKTKLGLVDCVAKVGGQEVCSAEIMFTLD